MAFASNYIRSLWFRGSPKSIGEEAFSSCLAYLEIPESVEYIGKDAFF